MNKKLSLITSVVISIVMLFTACNKTTRQEPPAPEAEDAVMHVNGSPVSEDEYKFYLETMKSQIARLIYYTSAAEVDWAVEEIDGKKAIDYAKDLAFNDIVRTRVISEEAKKLGISVTDLEKEEIINNILSSYFNVDSVDEVLNICAIPRESFDKVIEDIAYSQKYQTELKNDESTGTVSEEELRAKYDAYLSELSASGDASQPAAFEDEATKQALTEEIRAERALAKIDELTSSAKVEKNDEKYNGIN